MTTPNFGDVVETNFIYSQGQDDVRKYGFSTIQISGRPTIYHAGDVVHLPFASGELSTIEAIGLAWSGYVNGIPPEDELVAPLDRPHEYLPTGRTIGVGTALFPAQGPNCGCGENNLKSITWYKDDEKLVTIEYNPATLEYTYFPEPDQLMPTFLATNGYDVPSYLIDTPGVLVVGIHGNGRYKSVVECMNGRLDERVTHVNGQAPQWFYRGEFFNWTENFWYIIDFGSIDLPFYDNAPSRGGSNCTNYFDDDSSGDSVAYAVKYFDGPNNYQQICASVNAIDYEPVLLRVTRISEYEPDGVGGILLGEEIFNAIDEYGYY